MSAPTRAQLALQHLRNAAAVLEERDRTPLDDALLDLLRAYGRYWSQWLPAEPTGMDRAALAIARAITQDPAATAGNQSHPRSNTDQKEA